MSRCSYAGCWPPPTWAADYVQAFNAIFPELATSRHLLFYPFFLAGVWTSGCGNRERTELVQRDGLHPTSAGVDAIVAGILPKAEELVAQVRSRRGS